MPSLDKCTFIDLYSDSSSGLVREMLRDRRHIDSPDGELMYNHRINRYTYEYETPELLTNQAYIEREIARLHEHLESKLQITKLVITVNDNVIMEHRRGAITQWGFLNSGTSNGILSHRITGPAEIHVCSHGPDDHEYYLLGHRVSDFGYFFANSRNPFNCITIEERVLHYLSEMPDHRLSVIKTLIEGGALDLDPIFLENLLLT